MKVKVIPVAIVEALYERGHSDKQTEKMSAEQIFVEYCEWHGLINWGRFLFNLALKLDKLEQESS